MEVSTLLLIKDDPVATTKWTMGRIVQIHSDADGLVRVVTVKTADSLRMPLCKICLLPIRAPEPQDDRVCKRVIIADGDLTSLFVTRDEASSMFGFLPCIELSLEIENIKRGSAKTLQYSAAFLRA